MWKELYFNAQNIIAETNRATLIKMPAKSRYAGMSFWHPSRLIRDKGGKGYFKSLSYTNNWAFKLAKYGSGRYNRTKAIREIEISAAQFEAAMGTTTENIAEAIEKHETAKIPMLDVPQGVEIDDELRDND